MRAAAAALLLVLLAAPPAGAQVIDRVMAVVNGSVITQSEVHGLLAFGMVRRPADGDLTAVLDRLIERRLVLAEVNRYSPPEPAEGLLDARFADVRGRFASEEAFERRLAEFGFTRDALRGHIRDDLRIAHYLRQRFGAAYQPPESDILHYYRTHPEAFTRNGSLLSFGEAYDDARAAVIAERRTTLVRDWVAGLRRRANVIIPGAAPSDGSFAF